jgi:CDP-glycerol glycerophosphotransferase
VNRVRRRVKRLARQLWRAWNAELRALWTRSPVRAGTVLYEAFAGNGALCNPEAIFRELLASDDLGNLRHIWVLNNFRRQHGIRSEFAGDPRVTFVRYRSMAYFRALTTTEYLINNATFPPEFSKRDAQVYLNTWHGTPLKLMGYDMPNGAADSANTLRNFVSADFLLSQNSFMTESMYAGAYKLRGAFRGQIIEEGYPRVDRQFIDAQQRSAGRAQLEAAGILVGDREIVLYAPTWKGDSFRSPKDDAQELIDVTRELQRLLGDDRYVVLLKTHQVVHRFAASTAEFRALLVPNEIPTNTVLGLSSVLVTDYSSIFFDFLATGRPIVFYTPDSMEYAISRGTYFPPGELPGPLCTDLPEVAEAIRSSVTGEDVAPGSNYAAWRQRFTSSDDGGASRRVVDVVFRGRRESQHLVSLADDSRTPVLLHLGGMRSNGITTSGLNLLAAIDYDAFDISVVFNGPQGGQSRANQLRIDPRVRQFHRTGGMNGSKLTHLRRRLGEWFARSDVHNALPGQRRMWDEEWRRCFGRAKFEHIADFSGYGPFWATLLLHGPAESHSIWLHNNMSAETHRVIRGRERLRHSLHAVFALYREFDALVSVSPSLSEVNRSSLGAEYGLDPAVFVSARNLVDESHVVNGLVEPLADMIEHAADPETGQTGLPEWAAELATDDGAVWFATVGRFSTEKNQSRLIRAFALTHRSHPETRLILVGYGPLRSALERLIVGLGLTNSVFIAGPYRNPFPILAAADCFVLSSDYEGQPMVILEAAIAGLPIVSVDFGSIRDALPEGGIHIVGQDDESLAAGMLAYLRGEVAPSRLDVDRYNLEARSEFVRAITAIRSRAASSST